MVDIVLPESLTQARSTFRYIDSTGLTRGAYSGVPQTTNYGGDRIGATIDFTQMGGRIAADQVRRGQLLAFLMSLRGKTNRVYITDNSYVRRGTFPAGELLTNSDLSSSTGWITGAKYAATAANGVLRSTVIDGSQANSYPAYQNLTTGLAPYAIRALLAPGRGTFASLSLLAQNLPSAVITNGAGYAAFSPSARLNPGTNAFGLFDGSSSGNLAGDFTDILFMSASRCLLVDGGPNLSLQSDAFNTSWAAAAGSVTANNQTAPDGTLTADSFVENSSTAQHYLEQSFTVSSSVLEYSFTVAINAGNRAWFALQLVENTGPSSATVWFNANTGVVGQQQNGTNWTDARGFITPMGNGWFACTIVARKTNSATSISERICSATGDGASLSFLGNGLTAGRFWRATLAQSVCPTRLVQSTTTPVAASTQSSGTIYVKGGRLAGEAALTGALVHGDWIEVDGRLHMVIASCDLDAAGRGTLTVSPPPRRALSDNTPVIVHRPMGRFMLASETSGWTNEPGVFSQAAIDLEEAFG